MNSSLLISNRVDSLVFERSVFQIIDIRDRWSSISKWCESYKIQRAGSFLYETLINGCTQGQIGRSNYSRYAVSIYAWDC